MKRRWPLYLAVAAVGIGGLLAYQSAVFASRSGDATPLYSARRHDAYGTAALLTLLAERGVPTATVERPTLRPGERGVLVQVVTQANEALSRDPTFLRPDDLAEWVRAGNTVVQFSRVPTELMAKLHVDSSNTLAGSLPSQRMPSSTRPALATTRPAEPRQAEVAAIEEAEVRGDTPEQLIGVVHTVRLNNAEDNRITLRSPMTLAERPNDAAWTVLGRATVRPPDPKRPTTGGDIVAAELRVGRGRFVIVGAPTPVLNHSLGDADNLDFVLRTVGGGPVLLDEWSHGIGGNATVVAFLLEAGLLPLLLQIAFVAGLYVWSTSTRGPDDENDGMPARSRSAAGQIATLGFLYARSLDAESTFKRVNGEVRRRFAGALKCRPQDVEARCKSLPAPIAERCRQLFARLSAVRPMGDVRCPTCGYDLRAMASSRCPECGREPPPDTLRRVRDAKLDDAAGPSNKRDDAAYADILNQSHELAEEIKRERNVPK